MKRAKQDDRIGGRRKSGAAYEIRQRGREGKTIASRGNEKNARKETGECMFLPLSVICACVIFVFVFGRRFLFFFFRHEKEKKKE